MLESVDYATLLQYSPRGTSEIADRSRRVTNAIKGGRIERLRNRISEIIGQNAEILEDFLNPNVTLVPVPRSSLVRPSDLWPALEIANMLALIIAGKVETCLVRREAIKKSSLYTNADERPSIAEQYNSLMVTETIPTANITLVDDVLTLGRTSVAGASRLAEKFPRATIRIFTLMQTKGLGGEIEDILHVETGKIIYNPQSGKCRRNLQ